MAVWADRCRALFALRIGETFTLRVRPAHQRRPAPLQAVLADVGPAGAIWRVPQGYRVFFGWVDWWDKTVSTADATITAGLDGVRRQIVARRGFAPEGRPTTRRSRRAG